MVINTATTMVVEIAAGLAFGSMALPADGIHMASHAMAFAIALFAYAFARRYAGDGRFSFGSGEVNAMGGFLGAILLVVFAAGMAYESFHCWPRRSKVSSIRQSPSPPWGSW
ncbi:MAG: hypothetical protein AcusKO_03160 [Acuticoccus sp.]